MPSPLLSIEGRRRGNKADEGLPVLQEKQENMWVDGGGKTQFKGLPNFRHEILIGEFA